MNRSPMTVLVLFSMLLLTIAVMGETSAWPENVPSRDHEKINPYRGNADAVATGQRLFADHCASCHGKDAHGKGKHPPLNSQRVQQDATDGDLHWLLVNGNMRRGMPSWARLPDPQLWQLVSYLKSLHEPQ